MIRREGAAVKRHRHKLGGPRMGRNQAEVKHSRRKRNGRRLYSRRLYSRRLSGRVGLSRHKAQEEKAGSQ